MTARRLVFLSLITALALFTVKAASAGEAQYSGPGAATLGNGASSNFLGDSIDDQGTCATLKPGGTDASVELVATDPVFDNSVALSTLKSQGGNVHQNWAAVNKLTEVWVVDDSDTAGLAFGGVKTDPDFVTAPVPVDQYGVYYCTFFSRIHIKILYSTRVVIPSKFEPGSCAYQVIKAHEQMLVDANRKAMDSYVTKLRNDLPGIVDELEKGFSNKDSVGPHQERQKADLLQAVNVYISDTAGGKMKELASIVNTPEELKLRMTAMDQCGAHVTPPPPQEP